MFTCLLGTFTGSDAANIMAEVGDSYLLMLLDNLLDTALELICTVVNHMLATVSHILAAASHTLAIVIVVAEVALS